MANYSDFVNLFEIHSCFDIYLEKKLLIDSVELTQEKISAVNSVNCADFIIWF
jgi:hypothetical protein